MDNAIEVRNVSKQIKSDIILDDINFTLPVGSIYGITGHNGSGKSMLLRIITGLVHPSSGDVVVFGQPLGKAVEFAPDTGALIDVPGFLPRYSGFRNLELLAMIRRIIGKDEIEDALRKVGLDPHDKRPFRTYSTGMRQRLGIAQAIMEHPRLLILDEPTRGIDEEGTENIRQLILDLRKQGMSILITSHFNDELESVCDNVYMMNRGRLTVGSEKRVTSVAT